MCLPATATANGVESFVVAAWLAVWLIGVRDLEARRSGPNEFCSKILSLVGHALNGHRSLSVVPLVLLVPQGVVEVEDTLIEVAAARGDTHIGARGSKRYTRRSNRLSSSDPK